MKHLPLYVVLASIAFALLFRVVLPWAQVFGDGVRFNTVDAYIMVRYADCWPDIPVYDYFSNYPIGNSVEIFVWPSVIAIVAKILGVTNNVSAAVLPPILFLLTLIPLYMMSRVLFNKWVALGSVVLFCLLPGELLNRTMLGAADYHAWEIFLVTNIMMMVVLAARNYKNKIDLSFYTLGAVGLMALYWFSWQGALWLIFIFVICLTIWVLFNTRSPVLLMMYMLGSLGVLSGIYLINPSAVEQYWELFCHMFIPNISATTTETMPLFFSFGKFDLNTSWLYFGITFYLTLIGLGWLVYRYIKDRKPVDLVFLVWSIVSLGMTIAMRRFDYYFAINAAIIASFVMVSAGQYLIRNRATMIKVCVVFAIAVCLPLIRADYVVSTVDTYMSKDWQGATQYLKQYSDERAYVTGSKTGFGVLSWWDYGYWIMAESHVPAYITPGTGDNTREGEISAASILVSTNTQKAVASLRTLSLRFVVVDEDMLTTKWYPILESADVEVEKEKTLVYRLCGSYPMEGFKLVYESGKVKIYEVVNGE
jgi:asparagine N-glycosylation enzyme membrane subunit Stt3